jgi:hypothetical protein
MPPLIAYPRLATISASFMIISFSYACRLGLGSTSDTCTRRARCRRLKTGSVENLIMGPETRALRRFSGKSEGLAACGKPVQKADLRP